MTIQKLNNKIKLILGSFILVTLSFVVSCKQKVTVPAYILIDSLKIKSIYIKQGSTAASITDVWVYVDGTLNGIYPLPCKFPVALTGEHKISIQPGIKENGLSGTRINYPFYGTFDTTLTIEPEKEYQVNPIVPYRDATKMEYFEDFENGGYRLKTSTLNNSDSFYLTDDVNEVFEGKKSAKAVLKPNKFMEYATTDSYALPGNGIETYIELNYKTEIDIEVGFYQSAGSQVVRYPIVSLYKSDKWKKVYAKITSEVSTQIIKYTGQISNFSVYVKAENAESVNKTVLFDNIKLVRF